MARGRKANDGAEWANRETLIAVLRSLMDAQAKMPKVSEWRPLIALAAIEQLTPTLAALPLWPRRAGEAPQAVRDYFEAALFLNAERERAMTGALMRAMRGLEALEPVALKGAASLIGGLYSRAGARLMGDLDILVTDTERASSALCDTGFARPVPAPKRWVRLRHHHAPMQIDDSTGMGVELHSGLGTIGDPEILVPAEVRKRAIMPVPGASLRIPSATDRIIHAVAHDQISDRGALAGRISMRVILEVTLLARTETIDWARARGAFPRGKWRSAFDRVVALASTRFGAPVPARFQDDATSAIAWVRRSPSRPARMFAIAAHRASVVARTQPLALINLINPVWARDTARTLFR